MFNHVSNDGTGFEMGGRLPLFFGITIDIEYDALYHRLFVQVANLIKETKQRFSALWCIAKKGF